MYLTIWIYVGAMVVFVAGDLSALQDKLSSVLNIQNRMLTEMENELKTKIDRSIDSGRSTSRQTLNNRQQASYRSMQPIQVQIDELYEALERIPETPAPPVPLPDTPDPEPKTTVPQPPLATTVATQQYLPSCNEIKKAGLTEDNFYGIDPDGPGGVEPFTVKCDMTTETDIGLTIVHHVRKRPVRVRNRDKAGEFEFRPDYQLTSTQLKKLVMNSRSCRQYVGYECKSSVLMIRNRRYNIPYGWLVSRDNQPMYNWAGAPINSSMCACGVEGSCADRSLACNCDSNDNVVRVDEGYVMDKRYLPLSAIRLGDTGGRLETGKLTLGELECV
ncbi:neurexin-4-like [Antedon mediterranea]|uniref:neurexin-4-like n=1 Tax=Antedon mediterranea TaxID=105859 RepID=UPI003AF42BC4